MSEQRTDGWRRFLAVVLCLSQTTCTPGFNDAMAPASGEDGAPATASLFGTSEQALGACLAPVCFDRNDTLLHTTVENAQDIVTAAAAPNAAVLVAYRDRPQSTIDATDTGDIRVRLFDANGAPLFDDRAVKANATKIQTTPVVSGNANGFVVVWSDNIAALPDNAGYAIRARRLRVDGSMGAELLVNSTIRNDQLEPWAASRGKTWRTFAPTAPSTPLGARTRTTTSTRCRCRWGVVYADGFTTIGGQARNRIAALDAAMGNATAWNPNASGRVSAQTATNNRVHTGGLFTQLGGQSRGCCGVDCTTTPCQLGQVPDAPESSWRPDRTRTTPFSGRLSAARSTSQAC